MPLSAAEREHIHADVWRQCHDALHALWRRRQDEGWALARIVENIGDKYWNRVLDALYGEGEITIRDFVAVSVALDGVPKFELVKNEDDLEEPSNAKD